jgi:hypothetical protein
MKRVVLSVQVQVSRLVGVKRRVVRVEGVQVWHWRLGGFVMLMGWKEMLWLSLWERRDERWGLEWGYI